MADFSLKSGSDTLGFDIAGNVTKNGAAFGTWTVAPDNQISIAAATGGVTDIPAGWGFNAGNQFELRNAGAVLFNFHGNPQVRPDIAVSNGVLLVNPNVAQDAFSFGIQGGWDMDANFNLTFVAGAIKSAIDGILRDTGSSEFAYIFVTRGPGSRSYELDFSGKWQQDGHGVDVNFVYDKTSGTGIIHLPPGLTMDPVKNVLVYNIDKGTHRSSLTLAGSLRLNSNFSLTYVLDRQDDAGIQSTTFSIAARIKTDAAGEGNLQLLVQRNGQNHVLQIGGDYHGTIAGRDLTVGFTYRRTVSGTVVQNTVAFTGKITNPQSGNQFTWAFQLDGHAVSIDLSAHVMLGPSTCLNAALNFTVNGRQMGVTAMFGISTNCGQARPAALSVPAAAAPASATRLSTTRRLISVI